MLDWKENAGVVFIKVSIKPFSLGLLLLLLFLLTGCPVGPNNVTGSSQNTSSLSSLSSPSSTSSMSSASSQTFSGGPSDILLNHFGTTVGSNHTQIIVSSWVTNGITNTATNSLLAKEDISIIYGCEQTPVVFNGRYYEVVGVHSATGNNENSSNCYIVVMNVDGVNDIAAKTGTFNSMCSAMVKDDTLYIYGTLLSRDGTNRNCHIPWVFYTKDLTNWQSNQVFATDPVETIYNTSVCFDGTRYIMALEAGSFYPIFAQSGNGTNFTMMNLSYHNGPYNACPMIRYSGGYYYMIYLNSINSHYEEMITRTTDFIHWEDSPKNPVLIPEIQDKDNPTCHNTSDIDMIEYGGKLQVYYCIADQSSWFNIRRACYNGTMADFFNWFYQ